MGKRKFSVATAKVNVLVGRTGREADGHGMDKGAGGELYGGAWEPAEAVANVLPAASAAAAAAAWAEADHESTALCIAVMELVQGIVSVVSVVSSATGAIPIPASAYEPAPELGQKGTTVVVMGTSAGLISVQPQCRRVTVVVTRVAVGIGHV